MNEEIMEQLKENFPVLKRFDESIELSLDEKKTGLILETKDNFNTLSQQDCLELSQLFALLATAFEEV